MQTDNVFDDPREDGLDLFETYHNDMRSDRISTVADSRYIGWLSFKDFRFLDDLVVKLGEEGIPFNYFTSGILELSRVKRIAELLDEFVEKKSSLSRSDIGLNRSVLRLRAIIEHVINRDANLLMVSD